MDALGYCILRLYTPKARCCARLHRSAERQRDYLQLALDVLKRGERQTLQETREGPGHERGPVPHPFPPSRPQASSVSPFVILSHPSSLVRYMW
jgi:hypothetical protein